MEEKGKTTGSDWLGRTSLILSMISIVVAGWSAWYAKQQADLTRDANQRIAGKIPAKLTMEKIVPDSETLPDKFKKHIFGTFLTTFFCDTPDKLLHLNPSVVVKNAGEEPIDAVRVSVSFDFDWGPGNGKEFPFLVQQHHTEEFTLERKLDPGCVAIIPYSKGLLHQMVESQKNRPHAERLGSFTVTWAGRIVGSTSFDGPSDEMNARLLILWVPKDFQEEKCLNLVERMRPRLQVMKTAVMKKE